MGECLYQKFPCINQKRIAQFLSVRDNLWGQKSRIQIYSIERLYSTIRIHSHCGYESPMEQEKNYKLLKRMHWEIMMGQHWRWLSIKYAEYQLKLDVQNALQEFLEMETYSQWKAEEIISKPVNMGIQVIHFLDIEYQYRKHPYSGELSSPNKWVFLIRCFISHLPSFSMRELDAHFSRTVTIISLCKPTSSNCLMPVPNRLPIPSVTVVFISLPCSIMIISPP